MRITQFKGVATFINKNKQEGEVDRNVIIVPEFIVQCLIFILK